MKNAIAGIALALALGLGGCSTVQGMMGGDGAEAASEPASVMSAQPAEAAAPADACAPADPAAPSSTDACPPAEPSAAPQPQ